MNIDTKHIHKVDKNDTIPVSPMTALVNRLKLKHGNRKRYQFFLSKASDNKTKAFTKKKDSHYKKKISQPFVQCSSNDNNKKFHSFSRLAQSPSSIPFPSGFNNAQDHKSKATHTISSLPLNNRNNMQNMTTSSNSPTNISCPVYPYQNETMLQNDEASS